MQGQAFKQTPAILKTCEELARQGVTEASIARQIGISPTFFSTVKERFPDIDEALKVGRSSGEVIATGRLWELMAAGDKSSVFFYLKCQHGWSDRPADVKTETTNIVIQPDARQKVLELLEQKIKEVKTT